MIAPMMKLLAFPYRLFTAFRFWLRSVPDVPAPPKEEEKTQDWWDNQY